MSNRDRLGVAFLLMGLAAPLGADEERAGSLTGWVEDTRGIPVSGALVSLFGKPLQGGGLVTFTDSAGRFLLPSLPAGSYTLRALAGSELLAPQREVTVLPNLSSVFTLSLAPAEAAAAAEQEASRDESESQRELKWLLRHKRRSVLEDRRQSVPERADAAPAAGDLSEQLSAWLGDMEGTFELVTVPEQLGQRDDRATALPTSLGLVRLRGSLGSAGEWSLGGLLAESENNTWRLAGEFVIEPGGGHRVEVGTGYGTHVLEPLLAETRAVEQRSTGAAFVRDHWELGGGFATSLGVRYSYVGFVSDRNHFDPSAALEFRPSDSTELRAAFRQRTLMPGGDLLALSSLSSVPLSAALMSDTLRAERILHYELSFEHEAGPTRVGGRVFSEQVRDRLVNAFGSRGAARSLHILNATGLAVRGAGVTLSRRLGSNVRGSISYTYGTSEPAAGPAAILALPHGEFHDLVARLEAVVAASDTRLTVYYRLNSLGPKEGPLKKALENSRFDVQVSQGLPYLGSLTRAEWDVLLALRNVFYETSEGGTLDELAVLNPPTRVLGGISVRF